MLIYSIFAVLRVGGGGEASLPRTADLSYCYGFNLLILCYQIMCPFISLLGGAHAPFQLNSKEICCLQIFKLI